VTENKRKVATKVGDLEECFEHRYYLCFEVVDADAHVAQQHTSPVWLKCLQIQESDTDELLNGEWMTDKHISTANFYSSNIQSRMA